MDSEWSRHGDRRDYDMVTAWQRLVWILDWHGLAEIENRGGVGLGRWVVWVKWGCGVEIGGFSLLFDGGSSGFGCCVWLR